MEEVQEYYNQIRLIDDQLLAHDLDASARSELQQVRSDLVELVALMQTEMDEEPQTTSSSGADGSAETSQDSVSADADGDAMDEAIGDLVGSRCRAPYPKVDLPIKLHSCIILDLESTNSGLMVRVLYSNPMVVGMKPCMHFLKGTCKFERTCRFSHGELVPLEDLELYEEPDFEKLHVDAVVAVKVEELWDVGRVVDICRQKGEIAVKLVKSGREVHATFDGIVPVTESVQDHPEETPIEVPSSVTEGHSQWDELKGSRHGNVTVSDLGDWHGGGFGLKLMQKMGYKQGQGLGKKSDGIVHAIQAVMMPKNRSVDYVMEQKHKLKRVDGTQRAHKRLLEQMEQSKSSIELDIFSFLNRKLEHSEISEDDRLKHEANQLKKSSEKSLVQKVLDVDKELKELRSKERKLREGLSRNKNDKKTVERLQGSLDKVMCDIARVEGTQGRVQKEKDSRQRKKDLF